MNLNATLIAQMIVFLALWWFVAKFVWPPVTKALDERSKRIADGLAAADKAKTDLAAAERRVQEEIKQARDSAADLRSVAERQGAQLIDEARSEAAICAALSAASRLSALTLSASSPNPLNAMICPLCLTAISYLCLLQRPLKELACVE